MDRAHAAMFLLNHIFKSPILVASGTFGYGDEVAGLIDVNQLGGIITKSVTLEPREGNAPPRIAETSAGMLNSIGLANLGVEEYCQTKLPQLNNLETKVIINIAGYESDNGKTLFLATREGDGKEIIRASLKRKN